MAGRRSTGAAHDGAGQGPAGPGTCGPGGPGVRDRGRGGRPGPVAGPVSGVTSSPGVRLAALVGARRRRGGVGGHRGRLRGPGGGQAARPADRRAGGGPADGAAAPARPRRCAASPTTRRPWSPTSPRAGRWRRRWRRGGPCARRGGHGARPARRRAGRAARPRGRPRRRHGHNVLFVDRGRPVLGGPRGGRAGGRRVGVGHAGLRRARGARRVAPGPAADVHGLGAAGWLALTGSAPPSAADRLPLGLLAPDCPAGLLAAVTAAVDPDPLRRRPRASWPRAVRAACPGAVVRLVPAAALGVAPDEAVTYRVRAAAADDPPPAVGAPAGPARGRRPAASPGRAPGPGRVRAGPGPRRRGRGGRRSGRGRAAGGRPARGRGAGGRGAGGRGAGGKGLRCRGLWCRGPGRARPGATGPRDRGRPCPPRLPTRPGRAGAAVPGDEPRGRVAVGRVAVGRVAVGRVSAARVTVARVAVVAAAVARRPRRRGDGPRRRAAGGAAAGDVRALDLVHDPDGATWARRRAAARDGPVEVSYEVLVGRPGRRPPGRGPGPAAHHGGRDRRTEDVVLTLARGPSGWRGAGRLP